MADERVRFRCGRCQKQVAAEVRLAGRRVRCPACGESLVVPRPVTGESIAQQAEARAARHPAGAQPGESKPLERDAGRRSQVHVPVSQAARQKSDEKRAPAEEAPPAAPFWTPPVIMIASAVGLILVYGLVFGNLATRVFVVAVLFSLFNGYLFGATNVLAAICGMLIALLLAVPTGRVFEGLCAGIWGTSGLTNRMLSVAASGMFYITIVAIALSFPIGRFMKKRPSWKRYDRLLGSGLGLFEGILVGFLLLWAALTVEPMAARAVAIADQPDSDVQLPAVARLSLRVADSARESLVGRVAGVMNPLREMRIIRLFEKARRVLDDPIAREAFLEHPNMQRVRERESVKRTIELLSAEPDLADFEDGVSDEEIRALLSSSRLLEILDETKLLSELTPIADEIEEAIDAALK